MNCTDQIPKVIQAAKENLSARERLKPLIAAGWTREDGSPPLAVYHIRREFPAIWVSATAEQDGSFNIFTGPSGACRVKSVDEVLEFAEKLEKAVEEADLK